MSDEQHAKLSAQAESQTPPKPPPVQPSSGGVVLANLTIVLGILSIIIPVMGSLCWPIGGILAMAILLAAIARETPVRRAVVGLVLCLCGSVIQFTVYPRFVYHAKEMARSAGCEMNLKNLGKAIAIYREKNDDQYPLNQDALLQDGSQSNKMLVCLESTLCEGDGSSFFYVAPRANSDAPADDACIIACDTEPLHPASKYNIFRIGGRRNVLLSNGDVQHYSESEFQQELQKPQNRRFAEELANGANMTPWERLHYPAPAPPQTPDQPPDSQPASPGTRGGPDE